MTTEHKFNDIRDYFTAVCEHRCERREFVANDVQGTTMTNTLIGYQCVCGEFFRLTLGAAKCARRPLRPYITTTEDRAALAQRINSEPEALLAEMRLSGGWDQPDPGVAFMTVMAAALGSEGNPMEKRLNAMFDPLPMPPKGQV